MREATLKDITKFLKCRRVAVVGLSRNPQHFSRALFREFAAQGYDPVPVNFQAAEIEGRKCFTRLSDITPPVEAALLMTAAPGATDQAVRECDQAGIRNIWVYKGDIDGNDHAQTVELARSCGSTVVEGYCPFMFLPHQGFIHRLHGFLMRLGGSYPR